MRERRRRRMTRRDEGRGEAEDATRDEEGGNDPSTSGRDENRRKRPLEMTIEYTPSESEEGEGGMFARLPSQGAGANAGLYEYEDDSDSSDDDVRHPRARDDAPSCCCVIT